MNTLTHERVEQTSKLRKTSDQLFKFTNTGVYLLAFVMPASWDPQTRPPQRQYPMQIHWGLLITNRNPTHQGSGEGNDTDPVLQGKGFY